jgi:hypothetical protein
MIQCYGKRWEETTNTCNKLKPYVDYWDTIGLFKTNQKCWDIRYIKRFKRLLKWWKWISNKLKVRWTCYIKIWKKDICNLNLMWTI